MIKASECDLRNSLFRSSFIIASLISRDLPPDLLLDRRPAFSEGLSRYGWLRDISVAHHLPDWLILQTVIVP
jgi:hypothetical protein